MLMFESWQNRERWGERGIKKQVDHRGKQERDDKLRGGGVNKGEKKEGGCLQQMEGLWDGMRNKEEKEEKYLIFSSVIQSSEVLVLPLRLYDTVMLGSE